MALDRTRDHARARRPALGFSLALGIVCAISPGKLGCSFALPRARAMEQPARPKAGLLLVPESAYKLGFFPFSLS